MKKIKAFLLLLISPMTINANNEPERKHVLHVKLRERQQSKIKHSTTESFEITAPDLHGNTLKLVKFLEINNFIKISNNGYEEIVSICDEYFKMVNDENFLDRIYKPFQQILNKITTGANARKHFLRLIGDEIADQGMNDCLTFLLFKRMHDIGIEYEIIYSDCAHYFWRQYDGLNPGKSFDEMGKNFQSLQNEQKSQELFQHFSLFTMVEVVRKNTEIQKEIVEIIKKYYKPYIKLLSYSLSDNGITIFTHAPAGLEQIEAEAQKMGVVYRANSTTELQDTIDQMNEIFGNNFLGINQVHNPYKTNGECQFVSERNEDGKIKWQDTLDGKKIFYVHGHDRRLPNQGNVVNLEVEISKRLCAKRSCGKRRQHKHKPASRFTEQDALDLEVKILKEENGITAKDALKLEETIRKDLVATVQKLLDLENLHCHNRIGKIDFTEEGLTYLNYYSKNNYGYLYLNPFGRIGYSYSSDGPLVYCQSLACITKTNKDGLKKDGLKSSQKQYEETKDQETKKTTKKRDMSEEQAVKNNKDEDKISTRKRDEKKQRKVEQQNKKNFRMSSQM